MSRSVVAIIGRPNVGKSTLFNRLVGGRVAIEEKTAGVTRDRIYGTVKWLDREFILVDTGGIIFGEKDPLEEEVFKQAEIAVNEASLILMMVDLREGATTIDQELAALVKKTKKMVLLVCNKADDEKIEMQKYDFYKLGLGEPIAVSASHGLNTGDLLDEICDRIPREEAEAEEEDFIRVAIVGRPNVGKSSLVNQLAKEERSIVSDIPGTTRDAVDSLITYEDQKYLLVDTAGLRRKSKVYESLEYYSVLRSIKSMEKADIVVAMLDSVVGVTEQDKKIIGLALDAGKGIVLCFNKWDLLGDKESQMKELKKEALLELTFVDFAPVIFVSAVTKKRIYELLNVVKLVSEEQNKRIPTGELNSFIEDITMLTPPPTKKGKQLKIYYVTQTGRKPPVFTLIVNEPELMHFSYQRYLENKIREAYGFTGVLIKMFCKKKKKRG